MKKFLTAVPFLILLIGCGPQDVELTFPAELMEEAGQESVEELADEADEEEGINNITENDDGSVTVTMDGDAHQEMMGEMEEGINDHIQEIVDDNEFSSIEDIDANNSFDEFSFIVDQEAYENSFDGFATFGVSLMALMYQSFDDMG